MEQIEPPVTFKFWRKSAGVVANASADDDHHHSTSSLASASDHPSTYLQDTTSSPKPQPSANTPTSSPRPTQPPQSPPPLPGPAPTSKNASTTSLTGPALALPDMWRNFTEGTSKFMSAAADAVPKFPSPTPVVATLRKAATQPALTTTPAQSIPTNITRVHWRPEGPNDRCRHEGCGTALGLVERRCWCRKCGHIYCGRHLVYEMRLDGAANWDPENGNLHPVCKECFEGRDDYNDHHGPDRKRTGDFCLLRKRSREARLNQQSSFQNRLNRLRANEDPQSVVAWQPDQLAPSCPLCGARFTLLNRRHHCRLCGRVFCGSPTCTDFLPNDQGEVKIRACQTCIATVKRSQAPPIVKDPDTVSEQLPELLPLYRALELAKARLREKVDEWERFAPILDQTGTDRATHEETRLVAEQIKSDLTAIFSQCAALSKQISQLTAGSETEVQLLQAIRRSVTLMLEDHRLWLYQVINKSVLQTMTNSASLEKGSIDVDISAPLAGFSGKESVSNVAASGAKGEQGVLDDRSLNSNSSGTGYRGWT